MLSLIKITVETEEIFFKFVNKYTNQLVDCHNCERTPMK